MVTFMSSSAKRVPVPSLIGRVVNSAYIFGDDLNAHGVVLTLDDGTDVSIEFNFDAHLSSIVLQCSDEDDEAVVIIKAE